MVNTVNMSDISYTYSMNVEFAKMMQMKTLRKSLSHSKLLTVKPILSYYTEILKLFI